MGEERSQVWEQLEERLTPEALEHGGVTVGGWQLIKYLRRVSREDLQCS